MSDSDSEYNKVEESPFDDYGGPDASTHNYEDSAAKVNTKAPPLRRESNDSFSERNIDSSQPNSMKQMSMKFKDLITNIPSDEEEVSSPRFQILETENYGKIQCMKYIYVLLESSYRLVDNVCCCVCCIVVLYL